MIAGKWMKIGGALLALGAGWYGYQTVYAGPRAELEAELRKHLASVATYEDALAKARSVRTELKAFATGTLGGSAEQVEHRFRTDLNALAMERGLKGIQVSNGKPEAMKSPVGRSKLKGSVRRAMKDQTDFYVMHGEVKGVGTLEQALGTLAALQSQPWIHRVEGFTLEPDDKGRERFKLRAAVATVFFTDKALAPQVVKAPERVAPDAGSLALVSSIVERNVFKEPPPVVVAQAPVQPPQPAVQNVPPPPPPPPYPEWRVTGVVSGRVGVEAFLVNVKTGQRLTLDVGAAVADARFIGGDGEHALFEIGGQKFEVRTGQTLEQRRKKE